MPRIIDAGAINQISGQRVMPAIFVYAKFLDGDMRVWNGYGSIAWDGHTWLGLGVPGGECLGSISTISEDSATSAQGFSISLSGIDPVLLQHVGAIQQGLPCRVWINCLNDQLAVVGSALTAGGLIDQPTIDEGSAKSSITIAIESRMSDLQRAPMRRWTDQDQRGTYPTDAGFSFVAGLQMWSATWGIQQP